MQARLKLVTLLTIGALGSGSAFATLVNPGQSNVPIASTVVGGPGTILAFQTFSFSTVGGGQNLTGTLTEVVARESSGNLDFFYGLKNFKPPSTTTIAGFDLHGYPGASTTTNLFWALGYSTIGTPVTGSRSSDGSIVSFNTAPIAPGKTSAYFLVKTNAKTFNNSGTIVVHDGLSATITGAFVPTPEPGFYGMLALGLSALCFAVRRRSRLNPE